MKPKDIKAIQFVLLFVLISIKIFPQTAITSIGTSPSAAATSYTYTNSSFTYNWGLAPNNSVVSVDGFIAGGQSYAFSAFLPGSVRLRRVDNSNITGIFSLVWAEVVSSGTTYNLLPEYENDMEAFFSNRIYNRGTDNLFDNSSPNSNNIERLDFILTAPYSTTYPAGVGFAIFERGSAGLHESFCIAAITSVDGLGNPASYSNIVRVTAADYGDPGPNVSCRILKAPFPSNLVNAGSNTQNRGGVLINLQDLGITAGQNIYGYSLFSNDLPLTATPVNLVDFTNSTYFPTNTGASGGIDLIAVTGIFIQSIVLPDRFLSFTVTQDQKSFVLRWNVENETSVSRYEAERSTDGIHFSPLTTIQKASSSAQANLYSYTDVPDSIPARTFYYRIKQYNYSGAFNYSKIIAVTGALTATDLHIYPNPVDKTLYVSIVSPESRQVKLSISNSIGVQVATEQLVLSAGANSFEVNSINRLSKGIYQLSIIWPDGKVVMKQFMKK
jgi:hypothetical protein